MSDPLAPTSTLAEQIAAMRETIDESAAPLFNLTPRGKRHLAALRAALATLEAHAAAASASGWQDIASAPRDGTPVLIWTGGPTPHADYYHNGWSGDEPTHWQPLPAGPPPEQALPDRQARLSVKFHDKQYRDTYVASHTRGVLARQMRNFRGDLSRAEYAEKIGKQQTVIARLETAAYSGGSLKTLLKIARKEDVAVFVRFVDFPTFIELSGDLSDRALAPKSYDNLILPQSPEQAP